MPFRVIDLETTGFEPPAAVCEIGWSDVYAASAGDWVVTLPDETLVDPGHPIPPETSAVHHIVDADVKGHEDFADAVRRHRLFEPPGEEGLVLAAHNAKFERQWLTDEITGGLPCICTYKCALRVWPDAPAHNNGTFRYWLNPVGLRRDVALLSHRAGPDAYVTAFTLRELLLKASVSDLIRWSGEPALLVRCGFGKHRGTAWTDVPSDYLRWVTGQQMDEDVLHTAKHYLAARGGR